MAFDRILIPTDLSDFASVAIKYGAHFSRRLGSTLTLLFVEDLSASMEFAIPVGYYLEDAPRWREDLTKKLIEQARTYARGARVETVVATDTPSQAIVRTADQMRADLIIMGTHGRRGLQRALLGSVTERVVRHTERAVLTVTPRLNPAENEIAFRKIVCPVNFTTVARAALTYSAELANAFGAELIVVYVAEGPEGTLLSRAGGELASWIAPAVSDRIRYREIITHGDAAQRVLDTASELDADLIVIGSQHRFFSDETIVGTTTERVSRFSRIPVVTVTQNAVGPIVKDRKAAATLALGG